MLRIDSLQARITVILLLALLLPTALIAWFAYGQVVDTIKAERIKTVGRVADARHEQLAMVFQRAIVRSQGFLTDLRARCGKLPVSTDCGLQDLQAFLTSEGALGAILSNGSGGHLAVGDSAVPNREAPSFRPGQLAQFTRYAPGVERRYVIQTGHPDSGIQMAVTYSVRMIQPIFESHPDLGDSGETFLSDGEGFFITRARYASVQGHSHPISATPMQRCLQPENAETLDLDYRDMAIIHGFRFIPEIGGGCIMAHIDQAEAFAPIEALKRQFLVVMLIFAGLAIAAARYFARRLAEPVKQLACVTRSIAAGNLAARAMPAGYAEVTELASAFNAMTDQLVAVNAGLERRVAERTAELSESESRMRESEQHFRQLFNGGSDAIYVAELLPDGRPGKLIEVNDIACQRLGYSREEFLRLSPDELDAPGHDGTSDLDFLRKLHENGLACIERVHVAKDGRRVPVEINVHLFALAGKKAILGVARDISERKEAEEKLKASHNLLRTVIDTSPVRIFWKDRESHLLGCNAAFAADAGELHPDDLIGKDDSQLAWKAQADLYRADDRRVMDSGMPRLSYDEMQTTADGRTLWLRTSKVPLRTEKDGEVIGVLGIYEDVTAHKQTELALSEAKQIAERANSAKGEFLANMSHEIRTPMNAIIGLSDLALGLDIPPKLRDYCSKIQTSSKALLSILNDILDYSKVEAGRLELDQLEFSLEELLANVSDLFIVRAEEKGLELFFETVHVPPMLVGDPLRLGQVMNNLVGNAVKFTESGEIHVKVEEVAVEGDYASLRFSVRDTGIGMTPEQTERLFHAFTQADGSITRKFGGTGLGLTISKRLVEKMGGNIGVASEPGRGSEFSFTISLRVSTVTENARSPANLRGMRVLVVDDVDTSRQILREILTSWKFSVAEAASGPQALDILRHAKHEQAIELVLLDWKMPGMDGVELARQIQDQVRRGEIQGMPVSIMVTAYAKDQLLQEAKGVRLDAVLQKPVIASNLFDTIVHIQGGKQQQALVPARELDSPLAGARILLVEDNEINQQVAQGFLERAGLVVAVANNGKEALQALEREAFDAVLMDLQMPVMDGFEATRRIRQDTRFHDLPILALSAAVMAQDRAACRAAGMNDHVAKPVVPQEMLETLAKWIKPGAENAPECRLLSIAKEVAHATPDLPGIDLEAALGYIDGDRFRLEKLLLIFARQASRTAAELDGLLRAGHKAEAAALLHRIKGPAGTLGAVALHAAADRLERELQEDAPPAGLAGFKAALALVLESIAGIQALPAPEIVEFECEKCRWQRGAELFKELRGLLQNSDFVPPELITELVDSVKCRMLHSKLLDLQRQVDNFDYRHAQETLDSVTCAKGHDLGRGRSNAE